MIIEANPDVDDSKVMVNHNKDSIYISQNAEKAIL